MFENPNTIWIEILALVVVVGFVIAMIAIHIYKKSHHLPTGECSCCHKSTKKMLKEYHKCCCSNGTFEEEKRK